MQGTATHLWLLSMTPVLYIITREQCFCTCCVKNYRLFTHERIRKIVFPGLDPNDLEQVG
jgi:hypothetical protein